eukprot:CAMPEP_0172439266 /NCGR_PEP_ID=MMETSP1065-20121228/310_1 /TAXON_ID=265537 /ORGANISM="Amphiprora paludosa, Strain CCMP125" /LENGTH=74 /DNA_ID=CAMNT_0013187919 /DNA_START=241 /DNA_END=465 /DNA_ORIENTATION=-
MAMMKNGSSSGSTKGLSMWEQIEVMKKQEQKRQDDRRARLGIGKHAKKRQEKDLKELGLAPSSRRKSSSSDGSS